MRIRPTTDRFLALCLLFLVLALIVPGAPGAAAYELEEKVVEHTLGNGMRVLVLPRRQSPVVSVYLKFIAGAVDEPAGETGTAHLLEHMLFKGTRRLGTRDYAAEAPLLARMDEVAARLDGLRMRRETGDPTPELEAEIERLSGEMAGLQAEAARYVVKDEIDSIYTRNGGENSNAFTDIDLTTYKVDLPGNRLELWAAIESDRMRNPVLREFYSERDVVMEERRQSYDTDPGRLLSELFFATAFTAHPYGRPVIGWAWDVGFLERPEVEGFFRRHYSPDNAVLAVVGDVDPGEVIALVERYFGPIPPSGARRETVTREPDQRGERRAYLEWDANPSLMIGFHKPTLPHRDDYALDMIDGMLSSGRTSRLWRRLVDEAGVAVSVNTANGLPGARYDNLFVVEVTPLAPHAPEEAEALVYEELERLGREPAAEDELAKVRAHMKADLVRGLDSNGGLANMLSWFEAVAGDWRYITRHGSVLDGITAQQIMDTARRCFTPANRTVAILRRKGAAP